MKILKVKRITKIESHFNFDVGRIITPVTTIKLTVLGIPIKTLHKYKQTYHGEMKDYENETCEGCDCGGCEQ